MVNQIFEMAKPHFRHSSLSIKVNLRGVLGMKRLPFTTRAQWMCETENGKSQSPDLENLFKSRTDETGHQTEDRTPPGIPLIIFTEDCIDESTPGPSLYTTGCAHR